VWLDAITQEAKLPSSTVVAPGTATSFTGSAVDAGVKVDVAGFSGVLYGYTGKGEGTIGLYLLPVSDTGDKRKSDGGYVQGTYTVAKLKVGLSYGISELKLANGDLPAAVDPLLKSNASGVFGLYYSLTKSITLVGEYVHTRSEAWNGDAAKENDVALGGILFF